MHKEHIEHKNPFLIYNSNNISILNLNDYFIKDQKIHFKLKDDTCLTVGVELDGNTQFDFKDTKECSVVGEEYVYEKLKRQSELEYVPYKIEQLIDDVDFLNYYIF